MTVDELVHWLLHGLPKDADVVLEIGKKIRPLRSVMLRFPDDVPAHCEGKQFVVLSSGPVKHRPPLSDNDAENGDDAE